MKTIFELDCGTQLDLVQGSDGVFYVETLGEKYSVHKSFYSGRLYIIVNGAGKVGTVKIIPEQGEDVAAMFVTKTGRNYPIHQIGIKFYAETRCGKGLPIGRNHYGAFIVVNGITVYGKVRVKAGRKPL